jgi:hypothetical protein
MAGYKQTVIDDDAVAFWTFDGDMVDSGSRTLLASPLQIIDEIDNQNPAILHVDSPTGPHGYRMGMPSMIPLEMSDQASISFGYYGFQPSHPSGYAKAFLEVPHSDTFQFPNYGSFTVEFMMRKDYESQYVATLGSSTFSFTRPILRKSGVINIYWHKTTHTWDFDSFRVWFPSGQTASIDSYGWLNRNIHVILVWDVKETEAGVYRAVEKVFFDGRLMHSATHTYYDSYPTTNIASSWEIGGTIDGPTSHWNDRNTSALYLDQIAIYDEAFTNDQVAKHYKKIYEYDNMIVNDRPANYFPFDEPNDLVNWSIKNSISGGINGEYVGDINTIARGQPGPENIPLSKAAYFSNKALAHFRKNNSSSDPIPWFTTNGDYTVEFWFNTGTVNRGVLFAMQQEKPPFQGVEISINWAEGTFKLGAIEFRESENFAIKSLDFDEDFNPYRFNDGKWHHVVAQREGTTLRLWIDAVLHAQLENVPKYGVGASGVMYLMGSKPGDLSVTGKVCKFAQYNFALQEQQIKARYTYSIIFRIRGQVTLQGVPTQATIRVYKNFTGELISEIESDPNTGNFALSLLNNSKIDLMVFNKHDRSVRYRAYGPITPSEYEDLPILI